MSNKKKKQKNTAKNTTQNTTQNVAQNATQDVAQNATGNSGQVTEVKAEEKRVAQAEELQNKETSKNETPKSETSKNGSKKNETRKKSSKGLIIVGLVVILLTILGVVYLMIADKYKDRFLGNVTINGVDCTDMTVEEVASALNGSFYEYSLEIWGRDPENVDTSTILETISGQDINYVYTDPLDKIKEIFAQQNPLEWGMVSLGLAEHQEYAIDMNRVYDRDALVTILKANKYLNGAVAVEAQDAYISEYDEENNCYHVIPETKGTELDLGAVIDIVDQAVLDDQDQVDLEEYDIYKTAGITSEDKKLADPVEEINNWLGSGIKYDWHGFEVVIDGTKIAEWVSLVDGVPTIDEDAIGTFLAETSYKYDTMGKNRKFTTCQGVPLSLPSGGYGWKVDRATEKQTLIDIIKSGESVEKEPEYLYTAASKGEDDIGESYVEIDLSNQHLYLYSKGELVLETDFVSGNVSDGHTTPGGVFGITYKTTNAVLRGRDYETPVSYWMPFNGNIGMHDAKWRRKFGGDIYLTSGSHGCINLPPSKAEEIYGYVSKGFPVICYYYTEPVADSGEGGVADETVVPDENNAEE